MAKKKNAPSKKRIKELFQGIQDNKACVLEAFLDEYPKKIDIKGVGNAYFLDKTPLMFALQCCDFEIANLLIDRGANVNAKMSGDRRFSVLYMAVYTNTGSNIDFVEKLFKHGANPNVFATTGETPLHQVLDNAWRYDLERLDSVRLVKLFLENGADPDIRRPNGRAGQKTAREFARLLSDQLPVEICKLLGINAESTLEDEHPQLETILQHPDGSYRTAYQALREGIQMIFDNDYSDWVSIRVVGKQGADTDSTLWFKDRLLTFPFRLVTPALIEGCRNTFSSDLIKPSRKRQCQFVESASAGKIAAFIESIVKNHQKVKKVDGDYQVELHVDKEFEF